MSSKLDRFTEAARFGLTLSQEEALRLHSDVIGREHLLLGLVRLENRIPVMVLRKLSVEPGQVIRAVERAVDREKAPPYTRPQMTPGMKSAIAAAVDEARSMEHTRIGTGHLLLGLVHEEEGVAIQVLRGLGVDLDLLRTQTVQQIIEIGAQEK